MAATAEDVARSAGVSVSTVSRALTTPGKVARDTRDRVLQAAEQLRYRPSRTASSLASGRSNTIGLVIPDLENPYFSSLTKAIQAGTHSTGRQLFVVDTDEDSRRESEVLDAFAGEVDGVILCSPRASDAELLAHIRDTRVVTVNRSIPGIGSVLIDDADGSLRLHDLGSFQPYFSGGVAAADLLLASPATAVVAFNDLMALGLLDRVRGRGVPVPDALSIVSFDNTMFASSVTPHLTSVDFPRRLVARHTLDLLLSGSAAADAAGATGAPQQILPTQLTVRASSGPAPSHR